MSFSTCDNPNCGKTVPTHEAVWIAEMFTVCNGACKSEFLLLRPDLIKPHLVFLGIDIPNVREDLLKLAAMVL